MTSPTLSPPRHRLALCLAVAGLTMAASAAHAQATCRPPNVLTRAKKALAANVAVTKALEFDVRVRGSAAGMRRALAGLTEGAHLYGQICDAPGEFVALTHAAAAHRLLGRADSSLAVYRRAMRVAARLAPLDTLAGRETYRHYIGGPAAAIATINHYIGDVYRDLGRPDSALIYYRRGVGFVRHRFDVNLGEQELMSGDAASDDDPAAVRNRNRRTAEHATLASVGDVFRDLHRPDSALAYYRRAMTLAAEDQSAERIVFVGYGTMNMHEARYQIGMGAAFLDAGAPDSALRSFRRAGALARNWPLGQWAQRRARIDVLDGIGRALVGSGRPDTALVVHGAALADARKLGDRWGEMRALHAIARLHHRELPTHDLARAVAYYDSAASAFSGLSSAAGLDANRVTLAERGVALIGDWSLALLAREPEIGARESALAALGAAERGRAQALLQLMASNDTAPAALPAGTVSRDAERLVGALASNGTTAMTFLVTPDTLIGWLTPANGEIRVARRAIARDSLAALVAIVRRGLGVDDAIVRGGRGDGGGVPSGSLAAASTAARTLTEILLPAEWRALLANGSEMVVVAHGPLNLLPFGALPFGGAESGADSVNAWGSTLAIRQAPSLATVLEVETTRGGDRGARSVTSALIVGNPAMPPVRSEDGLTEFLPPLPAASAEARWIATKLGAPVLTDSAASERAVRARLAGARIVHLATHGFAYASDARARESFVALAADSTHDGLFSVGEILDDASLRLAADLVVLSACQTGLGDLKEAEGTIGLPRAFLAKGARSVLVSLWSVSDEATRLLMERFYTHWLDDADAPTKAQALQRASADVRATDGFEHPRFWAAFQVIGAR